MPFQKGNKFAKGGRREGSGRPPDEFKRWIKTVVHSEEARARYLKIIRDEQDAETLVTPQGVEVPVRAKGDTYLRAFEIGLHYAEGKPVQRVEEELGEKAAAMLIQAIEENRAARGLNL